MRKTSLRLSVWLLIAWGVCWLAYYPALQGPFLFDDLSLPFARSTATTHIIPWLTGVRPLLMLTYWLDFVTTGRDPLGYHRTNLILHLLNGVLVFLILRRALVSVRETNFANLLAAVAAGLFLVHPVQTEAVAYIAGRSDVLSAFFSLAALCIYLEWTRPSWPRALLIAALVGAACLSKEHSAVVPLVALVMAVVLKSESVRDTVRREWRLCIAFGLGALGSVAMIWVVLRYARTAGFNLPGLSWQEYFYTQWRVIWLYIQLWIAPVNLNVDHDVAISRGGPDLGAILGILALAGLVWTAWRHKTRFPLAFAGVLWFLISLAPTSSLLPIRDVVAERRLYFPMIGLLLAAIDLVRVYAPSRRVIAIGGSLLLIGATLATRDRSAVWSSHISLWTDAVRKSPDKAHPHSKLGYAYLMQRRCREALGELEHAARLGPPDDILLVNWGLTYECLKDSQHALEKLYAAAAMHPTAHVYSQIGMVYSNADRNWEAIDVLNESVRLDPGLVVTYIYRGTTYLNVGLFQQAADDFRRVLAAEPDNEIARRGLWLALNRASASGAAARMRNNP